jgi:hypothetical protein
MTKPAFRLAMRSEGEWWVASLAAIGTMEGAKELSRMRVTLATDETVKQMFIDFNTKVMARIIERSGSKVEYWDVHQAPEHERNGTG